MPKKKCPHCGASMVEHKHNLSTPLLRAMAKLYRYRRRVNLKHLKLTRNEWDNFQKLRYWDFVFQVEVDGSKQRGVWWLTKRGGDFLRGTIPANRTAITYRGERVRYEGDLVTVEDYLDEDWKTRAEYAADAVAH